MCGDILAHSMCGGAFTQLVPGTIQSITNHNQQGHNNKRGQQDIKYGGAFTMLVPGPIQSIEILINKSNTNKVKNTVCMVGCLYSSGARAHTIDSNNNKQKQHKQGPDDNVHGGVFFQ